MVPKIKCNSVLPHIDNSIAPLLRTAGIVQDSIVDGPGLRLSLFSQGCSHACPGCHNPSAHPFESGTWTSIEQTLGWIEANPLLDGITFSGGDPFFQAETCKIWAEILRARNLHLIAYTGFRIEEILWGRAFSRDRVEFLEQIDWLVGGRFVQNLKTLDAPWRGSSNQRIIDVQATLDQGLVINVENVHALSQTKPIDDLVWS